MTLGVEYDVLGLHFDELSAAQREAVLAANPRIGFKEGIIEAFSAGMRDKPETAFGTMNTDILEATVPGYVGRPSSITSGVLASRPDGADHSAVPPAGRRSASGPGDLT